jgi:hypothetical protein
MAILRSDATALEHILVILLEQAVTVSGSPVPPFFRACFLVAGCNNAIDFVSITPDMYGAIEFSTKSDGSDATQKLNIIQIKKLRSLLLIGLLKVLLLRLLSGLIWMPMVSVLGVHSPSL